MKTLFLLHNLILISISSAEVNVSRNVMTKSYGCPSNMGQTSNYCHLIVKSGYPYECPYKNNLGFEDYKSIITNIVSAPGHEIWVTVQRNKEHGYFEWQNYGTNYGALFNDGSSSSHECVTYKPANDRYTMADCMNNYQGLCVYRNDVSNFCDAYNKICNIENCQCAWSDFTCTSTCDYSPENCQSCNTQFAEYPTPVISLSFDQKKTITVIIENPLKLNYFSNELPIFCFSDVYTPSENEIKYRFVSDEITLESSYHDRITYTFEVRKLGPGKYKCEALVYPNLDKIESNTIVAGSPDDYGINFVLYVTIHVTKSYTFMPYNIHIYTTSMIETIVNKDHFQLIRPVEISPTYNGGTNVDMTFYMTTKNSEDFVEPIYEELVSDLKQLDLKDEVVDYTLLSSEFCLSTTTSTTNDGVELTWPTTVIGQTTEPLDLDLHASGMITRTCLGDFISGAYWSEVKSYDCPDNLKKFSVYCYYFESTSYPYECPYKNNLGFEDYKSILPEIVTHGPPDDHIFINVQRNADYGYYEWLGYGTNYGTLFNEVSLGDLEVCVVYRLSDEKYSMVDCTSPNLAVCVYRSDGARDFCDAYNEICDANAKCDCMSSIQDYTCIRKCNNIEDCSTCDIQFEQYPIPKINLSFDHDKTITVTIQNTMKLNYFSYGLPILCFSDVFNPSENEIQYKYSRDEISVKETDGNHPTYTFEVSKLGPGKYRCEGLAYSDMEKVESNIIATQSSNDYGLNFVLEMTILLTDAYTYVPYNIHTHTIQMIKSKINDDVFQLIRSVETSPLNYDDNTVFIMFYLTTKKSEMSVESVYNELLSALENVKLMEEVVSCSLLSSEWCLTTINDIELTGPTTLNDIQLTWPTTGIGQTTWPNENGHLITRTCMGNFATGAYWSEDRQHYCPTDLEQYSNYCYLSMTTSYPYECPYKDNIGFEAYKSILSGITMLSGQDIFINVKKNDDHGYYEWLGYGANYGSIFVEAITGDSQKCIVYRISDDQYTYMDCTSPNLGLCVYRIDGSWDFCDAYNEICDVNAKCQCASSIKGYPCTVTDCDDIEDCSTCDGQFAQYAKPTITLSFDQVKTITVTIDNPLKLNYFDNELPIVCFSDVYVPSENEINYRYSKNEITLKLTDYSQKTYTFEIRQLGPGKYRCEGFVYPDMQKIESNIVTVESSSHYGLNFVLHLQILLTDSYTFMPYNIHTYTTQLIESNVNYGNFQLIRPIEISPLYNNDANVNITLYLTTKTSVVSVENVYEELANALENLNTKQGNQIVHYSLLSSEWCITTVTIINDVKLTWPTTHIGQTAEPNEFHPKENGQQIRRTCLGNYTSGAYWSEVNYECPPNMEQFLDYCYTSLTTNYPYECPYKNNLGFEDYEFILSEITTSNRAIWINVQKNHYHGYYEWSVHGTHYGTLFNEARSQGSQECVVYLATSNEYSIMNCTSRNLGLCVYRNDYIRNFCDAYNEICDVNTKCQCMSSIKDFTCMSNCDDANEACSTCDSQFVDYPNPTIDLSFDDDRTITATIQNSRKLHYFRNGLPILCFSDVYTPSDNKIQYKYSSDEITLSEIGDDEISYTFEIRKLGPGKYKCEALVYPDMQKIESNTIIAALADDYGINFVLNMTLLLTNSYTFMPYNIHTRTTHLIESNINEDHFQLVRPVEMSPLHNDGKNVDITLFLTTKYSVQSVESVYEELVSNLKNFNAKEVVHYSLLSSEWCLTEVTIVNDVNFTWPTTGIGQSTQPLGFNVQKNEEVMTRNCLGEFPSGAYWSNFDLPSDLTTQLYNLTISNKPADELNSALAALLDDTEKFTPYDVFLAAVITQNIAQSNQSFSIDTYTNNLSDMSEITLPTLESAQIGFNATDIMLYNFDLALSSATTAHTDRQFATKITTQHIFAQVTNLKATNIRGVAIVDNGNQLTMKNLTDVTSIENLDLNNVVIATFIPPKLFRQIYETLPKSHDMNLITAIFLNDAFFKDENKSSQSFILSIHVPGFSDDLKESMPIIFRSTGNQDGDTNCGHWKYGFDESMNGIQGRWRPDNEAILLADHKVCQYSHMTHFALLVGAPNNEVLNLISLIGCVMSLIGAIGIIITAFIFKTWSDCSGTKILVNYSVTILIQMLVLFWSGYVNNEQRNLCISVAIVLHYIIISQFCWMFMISYLQYKKYVRVLVSEPRHIIVKSCILGWILPTVPVIAVATTNLNSYTDAGYCYLSGKELYLSLFLPISIIIIINIVFFITIFRSVLYNKTEAYGIKRQLTGLKIKLGVILFFLMGFSWIFGLLANLLNSIILSYIFCITSTAQGFVMYVYFIVFNKTTRKMWLKKLNQFRNFLGVSKIKESLDDSKMSTSCEITKSQKW